MKIFKKITVNCPDSNYKEISDVYKKSYLQLLQKQFTNVNTQIDIKPYDKILTITLFCE